MAVDFQLEFVNTILLLRDYHGNIIKTNREVPKSFHYLEFLGDDTYYNKETGEVWKKRSNPIIYDQCVYFQEEYTNITDLWNQNQKLLCDIKTDGLTQIPNIKAVEAKKKEIISNGQSCVLVMCDVNDFKSINDTYNHSIGDKCLIEIAQLLNKSITSPDLAARIGGDEFLLIFITDNITYITERMSLIQEEVKKLGETLNLPLSISIGISLFQKGDDWMQKKAAADISSYENKRELKREEPCLKMKNNA